MKKIDWGFWIGIILALAVCAICIFDVVAIPMWGQIVIACIFLAACVVNEFVKKN